MCTLSKPASQILNCSVDVHVTDNGNTIIAAPSLPNIALALQSKVQRWRNCHVSTASAIGKSSRARASFMHLLCGKPVQQHWQSVAGGRRKRSLRHYSLRTCVPRQACAPPRCTANLPSCRQRTLRCHLQQCAFPLLSRFAPGEVHAEAGPLHASEMGRLIVRHRCPHSGDEGRHRLPLGRPRVGVAQGRHLVPDLRSHVLLAPQPHF